MDRALEITDERRVGGRHAQAARAPAATARPSRRCSSRASAAARAISRRRRWPPTSTRTPPRRWTTKTKTRAGPPPTSPCGSPSASRRRSAARWAASSARAASRGSSATSEPTRSSGQVLVGRARLDPERAPPQRRLHGDGRAAAQLRRDRAVAAPAHAPRGHRPVGAAGHRVDERPRAGDRAARRGLRGQHRPGHLAARRGRRDPRRA